MLNRKKHKDLVKNLEAHIVDSRHQGTQETADAIAGEIFQINKCIKRGLTNINHCFAMQPEEHRFIGEFIRKFPLMVRDATYRIVDLESPSSPSPRITLSSRQKEFFSEEYDLRASPHDGTDHLTKIMEGHLESSLALFGQIMHRYIDREGHRAVNEHSANLSRATDIFAAFEAFIDTCLEKNFRFASIDGGSHEDREALVARLTKKTLKKYEVLTGSSKQGSSTRKIQPVELMRALADKDVVVILEPNQIGNLAELIKDISTVGTRVLVIFADSYMPENTDVQRFQIDPKDKDVLKVWDFIEE